MRGEGSLPPGCAAIALAVAFLVLGAAGGARAQTLVATDDAYGVPFGAPLVVEASGVLDNDELDGEPAGENGATAEIVSDARHGTLTLAADGSFTYAPGATFPGSDRFSYRAVSGPVQSAAATVTLSACSGGPPLFVCWHESAFLGLAADSGFRVFSEGFEDDALWGIARSPATAPQVTSRGITWQTNHPATNEITTGSGAARTGGWGVYDPGHGVATGTPAACDIDDPPASCLYHDGFTGIRAAGRSALRGVGGFIRGAAGANVAIVLDGGTQVGLGQLFDPGVQFFGVVDTRPAGFTTFEFRELDGKVGQALLVWGDDFTFAVSEAIPAVPGVAWGALAGALAGVGGWRIRRAGARRRRRAD